MRIKFTDCITVIRKIGRKQMDRFEKEIQT